jgi:DNA-binding CsgD family transcriptional regulator
VRKRTVETLDELTPQEVQVARLAAGGQANPEIGTQLFLSPRTVEWHLGKVFGKLGFSSRRELRAALSDVGATAGRQLSGGGSRQQLAYDRGRAWLVSGRHEAAVDGGVCVEM